MGSTGAGGSLRNIHKNPLKCNILEYKSTPTQKMIAKLAKSIENYVQNFCIERIYINLKTIINSEFCEKCGEFIAPKFMLNHSSTCKHSLNLHQMGTILHSITSEEKIAIVDNINIRNLILHNPVNISDSLEEKARILLSYTLKPKTLQNRLRKDKLFLKKMKVLDLAVKSLWK